jgi:hypothetical protein
MGTSIAGDSEPTDSSSSLDCMFTSQGFLAIIMAGNSADEIVLRLQNLPTDERRRILCAVCSTRNEIAGNCRNGDNV